MYQSKELIFFIFNSIQIKNKLMEYKEQNQEQSYQAIQRKENENTNKGLSKESVPFRHDNKHFAPPIQQKRDNSNPIQLFANKSGSEKNAIQMKSSKGSLPETVQTKMEQSMGADFSGVNIHTNSKSAESVGALAYTQGSDVHFAPGQFKPDTNSGQKLIGHELAHVVQQKAGKVKANKSIGNTLVNDNSSLEREADVAGEKAASGQAFSVAGSGSGIQMKTAPIQMKTGVLTTFNENEAEWAIAGEETNFWRLGTSIWNNEDLKTIDGDSTIKTGSQIKVIKSQGRKYDKNWMYPAYDPATGRIGYVKDRKIMVYADGMDFVTEENFRVYTSMRDDIMTNYIDNPIALKIAPKLGGKGAGASSRKLRDELKKNARADFGEEIKTEVAKQTSLTEVKQKYISTKSNAEAYKEAKKYVDTAVLSKAQSIVQGHSKQLKENLLIVLIAAYQSAVKRNEEAYNKAIDEGIKYVTAHKQVVAQNAEKEINNSINDYNTKTNSQGNVLFGELSSDAKEKIKKSGTAATIVKKQMDADSIGKGLQMIGQLIDTAVPRAGTEAGINVDLKIPVGDVGLASASILFHFGGEASKDYDDNNNIEINAKAEMGIGASFEVAKILEFKGQIDFYIEAQADSINSLMKLFSYGGFRTANAMHPTLAGYLWGNGGKSGLSRKEEAALWANAVEKEAIDGTENYVEVGGKLSAGMDFNTGIGKGTGAISVGLGKRFDKDTTGIATTGEYDRKTGKTAFFVNGKYEMELGGGFWGAAVEGTYKSLSSGTEVERETEIVVSTKLTSGYGNSASEMVPLDRINHLLSAASPWARDFEKDAVDEEKAQRVDISAGRALNNYGQSIGDLAMMSSTVHDKIGGFATSKMGEAGENGVTGEMEDAFEANTSTILEISFKKETNKTWEIEVTLKSEKEKVLRLGILEAGVTSSRKIASGKINEAKDISPQNP